MVEEPFTDLPKVEYYRVGPEDQPRQGAIPSYKFVRWRERWGPKILEWRHWIKVYQQLTKTPPEPPCDVCSERTRPDVVQGCDRCGCGPAWLWFQLRKAESWDKYVIYDGEKSISSKEIVERMEKAEKFDELTGEFGEDVAAFINSLEDEIDRRKGDTEKAENWQIEWNHLHGRITELNRCLEAVKTILKEFPIHEFSHSDGLSYGITRFIDADKAKSWFEKLRAALEGKEASP